LHSLSFVEDPTRILRAIRFEQRFGFAIGAQTKRLIGNAVRLKLFEKLSGSRLWNEIKKMLQENDDVPILCLNRMKAFHLWAEISPQLKQKIAPETELYDLKGVLDWYTLSHLHPELSDERWKSYFLALCFHLKTDEFKRLLDRMLFPSGTHDRFVEAFLVISKTKHELQRWMKSEKKLSNLYFLLEHVPLECVLIIMSQVNKDENEWRYLSVFLSHLRYKKLDINGNHLKRLGLPPGPRYKVILHKIHEGVLNGTVDDLEAQMGLAKTLVESENAISSVELEIDGKDLRQLGISEGPLFSAVLRKLKKAKKREQIKTREEELELAKKIVEEQRSIEK